MKFNYAFIRSKVARRVVWLFFISALLPIVVMALFSFTYVTDLLVTQSYRQLQNASKLYGMAVLEKLLIIDNKLRKLSESAEVIKQGHAALQVGQNQVVSIDIGDDKQINRLLVQGALINKFSIKGPDSIKKEKSILYSKTDKNGVTNIYLRRILMLEDNNKAVILIAELNNNFLWGNKDTLPFSTFLCVIEDSGKPLFCPYQEYNALLAKLKKSLSRMEPERLTWTSVDGKNMAVAWDLFIKSKFTGPDWKIIASRQESDALLPVYAYHKIFPLVILFSLLVVLLLSMIQVRRILLPLERLVAATRRLAKYEFGERVEVNSRDEFKELGDSFNTMASRLEKQFNTLKILTEIDRLILVNPDLDVVLSRIFDTAHKIISSDFIVITLLDRVDTGSAWTHIKEISNNKPAYIEKTIVPGDEAKKLMTREDMHLINLKTEPMHILNPVLNCEVSAAQIHPILIDGKMRAIFSLVYRTENGIAQEDSGTVRDIIDRLAVALSTADRDEKLYRQAHFDHLTNLPNRQLFNDRLEQHLLQAHRKRQRAALLYLDLDRFKNINDSLGHASGDILLRKVSERMRLCLRETDTISRLGGDEFVIVLPNISSPKDAGNVADHIIESISRPYLIQSREIFVNASIGIAIYPEDGTNNKELLAHADSAMYHAKESGRGKYMFFEENMNKEVVLRIEMETAMRHALQKNEFSLHYQPQIELPSGKASVVEALIRWNHPEYGLVSPENFIPLAEDCGLIEQIGEWVLREACSQYQKWRSMDIAPGRLAVNISSRQFMHDNFVDIIRKTINDVGMLANELELEITESLLMDERINSKSIFNDLENMGVRLAIDDFGTGYSSLSYLKRFSVHTLKIDRTFTQDIPADRQVTTLTLSIIAMAHALNVQVVAEGVETKEQLELLQAHHCDLVQGYLFSCPLSADEFERYLKQRSSNVLVFN